MRAHVVLALFAVSCRAEAPSVARDHRALPALAEARDLDPTDGRLEVRLTAERTADGSYTYDGHRPGPTLRAEVGDEVVVHLENRLPDPTTIHWHGVGVPNAMDGAPFVTGAVAPGEVFTYRFTVERAGTFWYHPHFDTARQVDRGLYGLFVVEDPAEPSIPPLDLIIDDPDELGRHPVHGRAKAARAFLVNGAPSPGVVRLEAAARLRARVLNASNTAYLWLEGQGLGMRAIAGDQGLDGGPRPGPIILGPGDRAELELTVETATAALVSRGYSLNGGAVPWRDPAPLLRFEVAATRPGVAPPAPRWPFSGAAPSEDPGRTDIVWTLTGSDRSGEWRIDGERFPNVTPERLARGARAVIEVRNVSPSHHPFHLHGSPFELLSMNGVAPPTRQLEDTLDIGVHGRARLLVDANRVGTWMVHCHILPHAEEGMMTLLEVE